MTGFGAMLSEARQARGLSLEQAERDTRIVRRYLLALEQEELDAFPAEVYARGFLRSYGSYLGLNPAELLALLPREPVPEPSPPGRLGRPFRNHAPGASTRTPTRLRTTPSWGPPLRTATAVLAILVGALLLGRLAGGAADPIAPPAAPQGTAAAGGGGGRAPAGGPAVAGLMPDLRGTDEREALQRLAELGVTPLVIEVPSREAPAGQVVRQSPAPNQPIGAAPVTIVVSRGG